MSAVPTWRSGKKSGTQARVRRGELIHVLAGVCRNRRGQVGLALVGVVVVAAIAGSLWTPHAPTEFVTLPGAPPTGRFPLGGDVLGRDVLSRTLAGGLQLLLMAVAATAMGIVLGSLAGISAAHLRGLRDGFIMRIVDVLLAFPQLVFALMVVSLLGASKLLLVVAVGLSHAPQVARVIRAAALDVSERYFVKAVEITGVRPWKVMLFEIAPNLVSPLMVEIGLRLTYSIVIMTGLSFIGFGLQPPGANWGFMINENRVVISTNPWGVLAPSILLVMLTIGLNTVTDAIARVTLGTDRAELALALQDVEVIPQ